jgi:hypothetical protein
MFGKENGYGKDGIAASLDKRARAWVPDALKQA